MNREELGRLVRETWVKWAKEQACPKPHWLSSWEQLSEPRQEADRRIGEAIAAAVLAALRTKVVALQSEVRRASTGSSDELVTRCSMSKVAVLDQVLEYVAGARDGFRNLLRDRTGEPEMMLAELQIVLAENDPNGEMFSRQFERVAELEGFPLLSLTVRNASAEEQEDVEAQNIGR